MVFLPNLVLILVSVALVAYSHGSVYSDWRYM